MTGGSLGLRTGSYGSLQPQLQNGVALPIQSTSVSARKPPKMLPLGSREKEKIILPWICKFCGKRKVGMLLLLIASVAVFLSFISVLNKDDDASSGLETNLFSSDNVWTITNHDIKSPYTLGSPLASVNNDMDNISSSGSQFPVPMFSPSILPVRHPCENISLYPVQIDRKRTGPRPCPVCYVPVEQAAFYMPAFPSKSPILKNLTYVVEENSFSNESSGGFIFGGHPSLSQRNDSFDIKESMTVHCGFVGGKKPGQGTGFDIDDDDLLEMDKCHGVVVASAIFGKYDVMQQPKNISEVSKRSVCFYMFLDEETEAYIKNFSSVDSTKRVGLWRIVVVRNLPYEDARRNGKVPKLLLHRLFPNARFSLWVDGKLELVVDPYQVLERFLWRRNASFAISRHYKRFDVFEEAEANKAAGKYDNASIDYQIEFYKREGLTRYSELKLPITSDVPEGCVIIREHIPITNLFTCIWFNEVDRFTSRDQLSFSTVRDKIMLKVNWTVDMFMDCERRNFVIQAYHRDLLEQRKALAALRQPPPLMLMKESPSKPAPQIGVPRSPLKKLPVKHRKSGSRRHRPKAVNSKDQLNITGLS
ncbi:uncharacterized protein LOC110094319 isoform X1 [Dendrobium catenatum]|uniref:TOD1/MUCI70 glycosyltransferase-like domain-containing protein n=1 Tax=Dendrobium catenatum TaxID=906689 RepID=A0A2I0WNP3_9ASPA|nr:uncharacterized protein LOC110094319 isoform X1 [Dendrobium catenatum]PKU77273.1 hypothetical protein MA16_Dca016554 [Dendrobium catenatum]